MRAACNKCHSQKLRCIRKRGEARCERCSRLDATCVFSPRAPRGSIKKSSLRASKTPTESSNKEAVHSEADMLFRPDFQAANDFDLELPFDHDEWLALVAPATATDVVSLPQPEPHIGSAMPSVPWLDVLESDALQTQDLALVTQPHIPNRAAAASELAYLNIALSMLAEKLPSLPESTDTSSAQSSAGAFIIDELFSLTTYFADLVEHCLDRTPLPAQDESTTYMIAACHIRLGAIYQVLFSLIQRCIKHSLPPPRPRPDWAVVLPNIQLGVMSSSPLRVSAGDGTPISKQKAFMYMSLVTAFSADLLGRLSSVVKERQQRAVQNSEISMLWTDMVRKADLLTQIVKNTQDMLT
ncbi:Zn(II)2Cys6 transcription factor domain-containing protein [Aspergillus stella-maris]|uniref:Zn(II)2Cys6 transcription factor domain-containing protein n=1 Tax=Aspergillus stella-maris TaxID=1810926 RepID=UPI003CCD9380